MCVGLHTDMWWACATHICKALADTDLIGTGILVVIVASQLLLSNTKMWSVL